MAETSAQKGVLWWAAHHRDHHRHSDQPEDPHSMKLYGFWYSHVGWIVGPDYKETNTNRVKDLARFKELVWINKYHILPPTVLATVVFMAGGVVNGEGWADIISMHGLSTLFIGFFLSTVLLYHGTFSINSLMHKFGKQRYETGDESRNSVWLALLTLGEGWHNNHHYYMNSTRQGFFWWEIDITFYVLKMLSWVGLVWDLQGVPNHVKHAKNMEEARAMAKREKAVVA
jgi:stearoyl-CoA desaturase (delta-9 desaturase)